MSSTDKNPKRSVPLKGRIHREDWGTVSLLELFHYDCAQDTASNVDSYSVYGLDENHLYGTVHAPVVSGSRTRKLRWQTLHSHF